MAQAEKSEFTTNYTNFAGFHKLFLNQLCRNTILRIVKNIITIRRIVFLPGGFTPGLLINNNELELRNRATEADHVAQEDAVFDYRMVVIVGEETGDAVGIFEAAFFVEADSRRHISRADNHRFVSSGIMTGKHLNHFPAKAPALTAGPHGYIFQFTHAGTFVGNDTFAHDDIAVDKNKHFAAPEIAVDHRLLLVGKQQQIQIAFLAICNLFHNQSHADTYLGVIRRLKRLSEARAQR